MGFAGFCDGTGDGAARQHCNQRNATTDHTDFTDGILLPPCLALEGAIAYIRNMTAVEIIEEIKRLPHSEQNRVIEFVRKAGEVRRLTPEQLGELAKEMVEAKDPAEADRLQAQIVCGFYGGPADA